MGGNNSSQCIRIVCAGLGRTGTLSLTEALKILGFNPYHYIDFNHSVAWTELVDGKCSANDIIDLIVRDGYDAVLENPTCEIYQDFTKRFPGAKVILTVRDTPQKFEESWKILMDTAVVSEASFHWLFPSFFGWIPTFRRLKKIRYFMGTTHLNLDPGELTHGWREKPDGWLAEQYTIHNNHIVKHVPEGNLLVFNVKEGWKPLCDFLGVEVPLDRSFPHSKVNNAQSLKRMRRLFVVITFAWIPLSVVASSKLVGFGLNMMQYRLMLPNQRNEL